MNNKLEQQKPETIQKLTLESVKNLRRGQSQKKILGGDDTYSKLPKIVNCTVASNRYYELQKNGDVLWLNPANKESEEKIRAFLDKVKQVEESGQDFDPTTTNIRVSVGVLTLEGYFLSESMLNSSTLLNTMFKPKGGKYSNSYMFRSQKNSDLSNVGGSPDSLVYNLQGKKLYVRQLNDNVTYKREIFNDFEKAVLTQETEPTKDEANAHFEAVTELVDQYGFTYKPEEK